MTTLDRISVIIPTYQRRACIQQALLALSRQTLAADEYEVIVSIDGSDDGTAEMVAQFLATYRLQTIWRLNQGRAKARNQGIEAATGGLLIFLDDDMEPAPEFLAAHRHAHASGSRLAVLGAVPLLLSPTSPPVARYIGAKFDRHLKKLAQPGYRFALRDFYSGNFSIRRDVLLDVGAFDEAFRVYGNEDIELSLRLSRAGVRLVYCPAALAYQRYTKGFAELARDNVGKGQTAVLLAAKHPDALDDLKLSSYQQASRTWRFLRAGLLALSRRWVGTPDAVIRCVEWLEGRRAPRLGLCYDLAADYFFWLGARSAVRDDGGMGFGSRPSVRVARKAPP